MIHAMFMYRKQIFKEKLDPVGVADTLFATTTREI